MTDTQCGHKAANITFSKPHSHFMAQPASVHHYISLSLSQFVPLQSQNHIQAFLTINFKSILQDFIVMSLIKNET